MSETTTPVAITPGGAPVDVIQFADGSLRQVFVLGDPTTQANFAAVVGNRLLVDTSQEVRPSTATVTNAMMNGSSVTLQAANTARRGLSIFNDSGSSIYVKLGASASTSSFTLKMVDQSYYELPNSVYTGIVTATGATGTVRVTELT